MGYINFASIFIVMYVGFRRERERERERERNLKTVEISDYHLNNTFPFDVNLYFYYAMYKACFSLKFSTLYK